MAEKEAVTLLKRFHELQGERVETYVLFNEGHKAYLTAAPNYNFPMYRQLVHEVTETFKKISNEIMEIESQMKDQYSQPEIGKLIGLIQKGEKQKLELTAQLQIAKQNVIDQPEDESNQGKVQDLENRLKGIRGIITEHMEELKYESEDLLVP